MPQFVVERNIPGLGDMETGDKMYCVHEAESADAVYRHAEKGGFPADRVTEITTLIGPHSAAR